MDSTSSKEQNRMKFIRTEIPEVIVIEPTVHGDSRGHFSETFREDKLKEFLGYKIDFIQDNESKSSKGVLRGLHYQLSPKAQTKLVRVIEGRVLDVAVDIRKDSPTFGKHIAVELSSQNRKQLLIPRGFAHGFAVLSEKAIFSYKVDNYYSPENDRGLLYSDFGIDWQIPEEDILLSEKDKIQPKLSEAEELFTYGENLYV